MCVVIVGLGEGGHSQGSEEAGREVNGTETSSAKQSVKQQKQWHLKPGGGKEPRRLLDTAEPTSHSVQTVQRITGK